MSDRVRKRRRLLIGLLVAANVLWAVFVELLDPPQWNSELFVYSLLATLPSQGSLLGFWAALGGEATPWRLVAAVAGIPSWILATTMPDADLRMVIWLFVLLAVMCLTSVVLMTARFLGAELTDILCAEPRQPDGQWMQFSLRSLFSWTTALALLLASLCYLPVDRMIEFLSRLESVLVFAAIVTGSALICLGAIWITLGTRWPPVRYVALALTGAAAIGLMYLAVGPGHLEALLTLGSAQVVWVTGSLWLVRLAGYRLGWRRRVRL